MWEPRQVWTAATCLGFCDVGDVEDADAAEAVLLGGGRGGGSFSVAGGGRWRSGGKAWAPQSRRPLGISTDMKRRLP